MNADPTPVAVAEPGATASGAGGHTRTGTRHVRVFRFKRGEDAPRFEEYDVPVGEPTTILEACAGSSSTAIRPSPFGTLASTRRAGPAGSA